MENLPKCDFCDKMAVHFCSMAIAQSCQYHMSDANKAEQDFWSEISTQINSDDYISWVHQDEKVDKE